VNPLSAVTVASLADLGYTVNMAAADPFTPAGLARTATTGTSLVRLTIPVPTSDTARTDGTTGNLRLAPPPRAADWVEQLAVQTAGVPVEAVRPLPPALAPATGAMVPDDPFRIPLFDLG
jgi:hypothetical protein